MVKLSSIFCVAASLLVGNTFAAYLDPAIPAQEKKDLEAANIIPELLPPDFQPTSFLKIMYGDRLVNAGDELLPEEVAEMPHVWFPAPDMDKHYTMVMVDADATVPLVKHWIASNVEGGKPGSGLRDADPLHRYVPYHGPTPPKGTGKHRYVFILYEQSTPNQTLLPELEDPDVHRAFFNLDEFTKQNNLKPVAASYILVAHQDGYEGDYLSRHAEVSSRVPPATATPAP